MAVVVGTVQTAFGFTTPKGPEHTHTISAAEYKTEFCFVHVIWPSGTYASGDDANFNAVAAIQLAKKDGKTPVVIGASGAGAGDENGAIIGVLTPVSISGSVVTLPLTQEDLATERADGAMSATWNLPVTLGVWFYYPAD
jgi:hypothetical protein